MSQPITDLENEIQEIEDFAPSLGTDKEALYDLLIKAYFKQKDLIVLLKAKQPEKETVIDTDEVDRLTFELNEQAKEVATLKSDKEFLSDKLGAIKDLLE